MALFVAAAALLILGLLLLPLLLTQSLHEYIELCQAELSERTNEVLSKKIFFCSCSAAARPEQQTTHSPNV